jgi:hypothetical protein
MGGSEIEVMKDEESPVLTDRELDVAWATAVTWVSRVRAGDSHPPSSGFPHRPLAEFRYIVIGLLDLG